MTGISRFEQLMARAMPPAKDTRPFPGMGTHARNNLLRHKIKTDQDLLTAVNTGSISRLQGVSIATIHAACEYLAKVYPADPGDIE